ncbi:MAG: DUF2300 domain-containing protein [Methylococcales bacterium]
MRTANRRLQAKFSPVSTSLGMKGLPVAANGRFNRKHAVMILLLFAPWLQAQDEHMQLALRDASTSQLWQIDAQARVRKSLLSEDLKTPLGSLWKLFVYDYLVNNQIAENPYVCRGRDNAEVYCCETGRTIERDAALVKSCGLYFASERWNITAESWAKHWAGDQTPSWFKDLGRIRPDTRVAVSDLLKVLSLLPSQARARRVLLDKLLIDISAQSRFQSNQGPMLASMLGSQLRIKSWSWHESGAPDQRIGGFAGWLADGTPLWASAKGTSQQMLEHFAPALNRLLPVVPSKDPAPCVEVTLFERYPISAIQDMQGKPVTAAGPLHGRYTVAFGNGNHLDIESRNDLFLTFSSDRSGTNPVKTPHLQARLDREDYIARVLDREAAAVPEEAAKALAIAARTYLLQNGTESGSCLHIDDSSHSQRVAPRPATAAARRIADWTADLVLAGTPVTYHRSEGGRSRLSWERAKEQAASGWRYDAILANAFVHANLARWDNPRVNCQALPNAQQWLHKQMPLWRERLDREPGYEETREFMVCRLLAGKSHVDRSRRRIYVRNLLSLQDRLDLTHEYLHLAFEAYPSGQDEHYVEDLARYLLLE